MWPLVALAGGQAAMSYLSARSSQNAEIRRMNAQSKAEGEAVVRERLNTTIRNAYSTAFSQMQLGLQKRRHAAEVGAISAAELAARGAADVQQSGSIGASVEAVGADIEMRADQARQAVADNYQAELLNYNNSLDMMVLNTDQSAPQVREPQYIGPSNTEMLTLSLLQGASSFASSYAMSSAKLGAGAPAQTQVPSTVDYSFGRGVRLGGYP